MVAGARNHLNLLLYATCPPVGAHGSVGVLPLGCVFDGDTINGRMLSKNLNPLKRGGSH